MKAFTILSAYLLLLANSQVHCQNVSKEAVMHLINANGKDSFSLKSWSSCSTDSSFFKMDTIQFYYALEKSLDCKESIEWTFFDSTMLFQEYKISNSGPVKDINPENVYNYKFSFSSEISKVSIFQNDMLVQRYKIIYVDKLVLLENKIKCRSIGLVKIE